MLVKTMPKNRRVCDRKKRKLAFIPWCKRFIVYSEQLNLQLSNRMKFMTRWKGNLGKSIPNSIQMYIWKFRHAFSISTGLKDIFKKPMAFNDRENEQDVYSWALGCLLRV